MIDELTLKQSVGKQVFIDNFFFLIPDISASNQRSTVFSTLPWLACG